MVKLHTNMVQGSDEWLAARCGLLTASEMKYIITPSKLEYAKNDKAKAHLYELLAQRVTGYVEPSFISDDMLRGKEDEIEAIRHYQENYAYVQTVGFITNDKWGFTLGYSPDALVGEDGTIEVKGRRQKYQAETIIKGEMPDDYLIQVQTGLLVSERKWCDFLSYSGGMHMIAIRVHADQEVQEAIITAATVFHEMLDTLIERYQERINDKSQRLVATERRIIEEILI